MSMIKREKYQNCPLAEVVYQLNFPTILSIDVDEPVKFQDAIRGEFPIYRSQIQEENEVTINVIGNNSNPVFRRQGRRKNHFFISEDEKWRISLANNMIAISTLNYDHWEDMKERFQVPMTAFADIYHPAYFERAGMRYIDVLIKKNLGVQDKNWNELLQPHLCGILGYNPSNVGAITTSMVNADVIIDDVSIHVECGLGASDQRDGKGPIEAVILNCDYYKLGKYKFEEISSITEKIHEMSHRFFRESITDTLHQAMKPIEIT